MKKFIPLLIDKKNILKTFSLITLMVSVCAVVYINLQEKNRINESRLPSEVATNKYFNKWLTNLKNKGVKIEGEEFAFLDEREALNMSSLNVYSLEDIKRKDHLDQMLRDLKETRRVVYSPNNMLIIDYRDQIKEHLGPHQVRLYGQKASKIIDARIVDCYTPHNCYIDRAYFLTNDYFVIHEISLASNQDTCTREEVCKHTFKIHLVDLINNKVKTYISNEKDLCINEWIRKNS